MDDKYKYLKDPSGVVVFEAVRRFAGEFTNDSPDSKFLLIPDKISDVVYSLSITFARLSYSPDFPEGKAKKLGTFNLYYSLILAGIQIYLKDQSIFKNMRSYVWEEKDEKIKRATEQLWKYLVGRINIERYLCEVMDETVYRMKETIKISGNFERKGYKLLKREMNKWCDVSILSGYFLAKNLTKFTQ